MVKVLILHKLQKLLTTNVIMYTLEKNNRKIKQKLKINHFNEALGHKI